MFVRAGSDYVNLAHVSKATVHEADGEDPLELDLRIGSDGASIVRLSGDEARQALEVLDACLVRAVPAEVGPEPETD